MRGRSILKLRSENKYQNLHLSFWINCRPNIESECYFEEHITLDRKSYSTTQGFNRYKMKLQIERQYNNFQYQSFAFNRRPQLSSFRTRCRNAYYKK